MSSQSSDQEYGSRENKGKREGEKTEEEQILTCPGCMKMLTDPMTLRCIHVFCSDCTRNLERVSVDRDGSSGVECPICGGLSKESDIEPSELMSALVEEYHNLQRPLEGKRRLCDQCENNDSFYKCHECKIYLCETCVQSHQRIPYCKGHRSFPGGLETFLVVDKVIFCRLHPDMRIEYNCAECEEPICEMCKANGHESHEIESVQEALDRLRPIHEQHCKNLDEEISLLQQNVDELDEQAAATHNPTDRQRLTRTRDDILDLMTKYHTLRWWIALAMDRARGAFLLRELQGHIKQRLEENGQKQPERMLESVQSQPEKPKTVKRPDDKKQKHHYRQAVFTRCSLKSFKDILKQKDKLWMVENQIHISGDGCRRMGYINDKIWLPIHEMDHIKILNSESGSLVSLVELPESTRPWAVQQINHTTIIMAAETGLYSLKYDGSIKEKLRDGSFNDVNPVGSDRFVCLEYRDNIAIIFQCSDSGSNEAWKEKQSAKLETHDHRLLTSVMMFQNTVVASSNSLRASTGVIHKYTPSKKDLDSHLILARLDLRRPTICGVDSRGFILVADAWKNNIFLVTPNNSIRPVKLHNQRTIKCPKDLLFTTGDTMWLLEEEAMGNSIMVKYVRRDNPDKKKTEVTPDVAEDTSLTGSDEAMDSGSAGE